MELLLSFIWLGYGSDGISGVLSLQAVFVHGGWKLLYHRNRSPFRHSSPIRTCPRSLMDGEAAAWLVFLYEWYLHDVEILWLFCSNRAFMDGAAPLGLRKLFVAVVLPVPVPPCVLQWSVCGFLPVRFAVRLWQFGSGSRWK